MGNLVPLVRKTRGEHAQLGMVFPMIASQPALLIDDERMRHGEWRALLLEAAVVPSRLFIVPDEVVAMRRLFDYYRQAPQSGDDETPRNWADLYDSVATDRTSIYSAIYIKPKLEKILFDAGRLAALRQTGQAGLATEAYRRKHGRYPEPLEQLVPEFMPAMPVDPRDGQPLHLKRVSKGLVLYTPQDSLLVDSETPRAPANLGFMPIFRLFSPSQRDKP